MRDALAATLAPKIVLGDELTGGGMARVFRARDTTLDRNIVVKVVAPVGRDTLRTARFRREITTAAALQHPQIVPILDTGDVDGLPWYSMPFVAGASLQHRLDDGPPLTGLESLDALRDVVRALAAAHAQGVVHRDIKPGNVLLAKGAAVVTDFGLATAVSAALEPRPTSGRRESALTQPGVALGTPAYMAPEQVAGDRVDARADVYA
jgi:eukaryotic-like serine/threonine-protein kinase